jgi:hypothetical protein
MKIYINNKDLSKIDIEFETTFKQSLLYTTDGIFHHKKDIHKIEYTETKIEEIYYKDNHFFIDNSKIIYTDIIYNIPFLHLYCEELTYKKNIGDDIFFIKNSYFDQNVYYFETNFNYIDDTIFDKIITFLSSN